MKIFSSLPAIFFLAEGKAWENFQDSMGKNGKGEMNINGKELLEF